MRKISSSANQRCRSSLSRRAEARSRPNGFSTIEPHVPFALPPLADLPHDGLERLRGHRQVVDPVAARATLLVELHQRLADTILARVVVELGRDVADARGELLPDVGAERVARVLLHGLAHRGDELRGRLPRARDPHDRELLRQQAADGERVQSREELALRQVARRAEDHERARLGATPQPQPLGERVRAGAHAPARAPSFERIPSRSSTNESANFCTPSASSVATTSS